jgi:hypothetical protein
MSITAIGRKGEILAREILLKIFKSDNIFQADWIAMKDNKYYVVEVKHKEMFQPPPFMGQGLDIRQVKARMQFYKDTTIRCLFLVIDKDTRDVYWQWLDVLENGEYHDTKNGIRIYNIMGFKKSKRLT